ARTGIEGQRLMSRRRASQPLRADRPEPPRTARFVPGAVAIVVLALGVRLVYFGEIRTMGFFVSPVSDAAVYIERGRGIAGGDWLGPADFVHAPLYAYVVGAVMRIAGPEPWWTLRVAQAALGAAACGLLAFAGRHWFGPRAGIIAGLILA